MLGQVHVAARSRLLRGIWALAPGGPLALLPLAVAAVRLPHSLMPALLHDRPNALSSCTRASALLPLLLQLLARALADPIGPLDTEAMGAAGPGLLETVVGHVLRVPSPQDRGTQTTPGSTVARQGTAAGAPPRMPAAAGDAGDRDRDTLAAVMELLHAPPRAHSSLRVLLLSRLLLNLPLWSSCSFALQRELLAKLAGLAVADQQSIRAAGGIPV